MKKNKTPETHSENEQERRTGGSCGDGCGGKKKQEKND